MKWFFLIVPTDSFNSNEESKNFKGAGERRERLESTSLEKTPVDDFALQDFHQHRLEDKADPFDLRYHLYAIVSHSGILGGGHYVSYACNPNGKWYCYNDSSCKVSNSYSLSTHLIEVMGHFNSKNDSHIKE